jgi:hypothetical protein
MRKELEHPSWITTEYIEKYGWYPVINKEQDNVVRYTQLGLIVCKTLNNYQIGDRIILFDGGIIPVTRENLIYYQYGAGPLPDGVVVPFYLRRIK